MAPPHNDPEALVLTASLTSGVACVTHGLRASARLVDEILTLNHTDWETTLSVGGVEFHQDSDGPYPNHQMRVSVNPGANSAALNYMHNDEPGFSVANSYNPGPEIGVDLIFNGTTGAVFPRSAVISIVDARRALNEWLRTRRRPTCIEWRPHEN